MNSSELFQILKEFCLSGTLNMPTNLENSAVATGLENVSFHSNPEKGKAAAQLHSSYMLA